MWALELISLYQRDMWAMELISVYQRNMWAMELAELSKQKLCSEGGLLNQNLTTTGARIPFCILKNFRWKYAFRKQATLSQRGLLGGHNHCTVESLTETSAGSVLGFLTGSCQHRTGQLSHHWQSCKYSYAPLKYGIKVKNASFGGFIIMWTSQSVHIQTMLVIVLCINCCENMVLLINMSSCSLWA